MFVYRNSFCCAQGVECLGGMGGSLMEAHKYTLVSTPLQVDSAYHSGNDQYAKRKSKAALHWSIAGIVFGVLVHLAWIGGAIYLIIKWTTPSVY